MCDGASQPVNVGDALGMLDRALSYLTATDAASLPAAVQADALRALGRAEAKHTAAQARLLSVFAAQGGCEDDGHGGARAWLKWQTRVSHGAAVAAVAWARRLAAHPAIAGALAAGELSPSWARHLCEWSDRLPEDRRSDADEILAGAARGGADLAALAGLAREMYERSCQDGDTEPEEDRFTDRWFRLGITFQGAGRAEGDLTPGCAAALAAVLEALGKKAGPEDTRTSWQRRHDALEEACRRLIRAGMVPARAGQPTQVLVHLTLAQVREATGASAAEDAWAAARAAQPGWLTGPEADAALCDATVVPIVTGHVDWAALDQLTDTFLLGHGTGRHTGSAPGHHNGTGQCGSAGPGQAGGYQCGDADRAQQFFGDRAKLREARTTSDATIPTHTRMPPQRPDYRILLAAPSRNVLPQFGGTNGNVALEAHLTPEMTAGARFQVVWRSGPCWTTARPPSRRPTRPRAGSA